MKLPFSKTTYSPSLIITTIVLYVFTCGFNPADSKKKELNLPKSGVNMTWQTTSYLTSSLAFTNAMKHCSGWDDSTIINLDQHGYPLTLEEGQEATTFIFRENKYYPAGEYTLQWDGTGVISVSSCNQKLTFGPDDKKSQTISVSNTTCTEGIQLTIESTRKDDHIRNIRFYLPGYDGHSGMWTDHFVDFHAQFGVTRFAWGSGLYCPQTKWKERSEMQDLNWTDNGSNPIEDNGIPYEAMVELANRAGVDLWICSPVRANRDFQTKLARLVRNNLDDDLRCWIEWGNEYWNCGEWGYEGCVFLEELSAKNGLSKRQNYARESLDLFEDFHRVFSETGERNRLLTVLGGQSGYAEELKQSAREIDESGRMDEVDLFAIAPYYHQGRKINITWKQGGIDAVFPILNQIVEDMYNGKGEAGEQLARNFELAATYNKPVVAYEGGQHLTSWMGLEEGLTAIINRSPQMYHHYLNYFKAWEQEEVTRTFVHYCDIAFYNDYEAFGLKEYYDQPLEETHKLRAFLDWIKGSSAK